MMRERQRLLLLCNLIVGGSVLLSGCISQEGVMLPNGKITPCNGWHTDNQACGNALFNTKQISRVELGQTPSEVRTIMKHDAERREAMVRSDGGKTETWSYLTDYDAEQMTTLTFVNSRLTAIGKAPWRAQP